MSLEPEPLAVKDWRPKILGSPRAHALLQRLVRLDLEIGWDGKPYAPMVHQADGLACIMGALETAPGAGLLHDMGCGKTLTMIGLLLARAEEGRAERMFVACPKSVVHAWNVECRKLNARVATVGESPRVEFLGLTQRGSGARADVLTESLADRARRRARGEHVAPLIVAMNYESCRLLEKVLRDAEFDIVAADESQKIKGAGTAQSLALYRIGKPAADRVLMTGTPVSEGGLDWYGQWRFAHPQLLGTNWADFKARFAIEVKIEADQETGRKGFRKVSLNPHTKHILEGLVMPLVHRVSKDEALDLPPQFPTVIQFEMAVKQRKIYDDLMKESIALIERREIDMGTWSQLDEEMAVRLAVDAVVGDNVLTRMLRLQQITGGYMQLVDRAGVVPCAVDSKGRPINPKLSALEELMETLRDTGHPLVIFHRFTHEGQAIAELAQRMVGRGKPVSIVNGNVSGANRGHQIDQFQDGDTPFFIGQIQACAEGITLHRAHDSAMYSIPTASAIYQQALSRLHRTGQVHNVTHHHLIATRSVDETMYLSQLKKHDAAIDLTDGAWRRHMTGTPLMIEAVAAA